MKKISTLVGIIAIIIIVIDIFGMAFVYRYYILSRKTFVTPIGFINSYSYVFKTKVDYSSLVSVRYKYVNGNLQISAYPSFISREIPYSYPNYRPSAPYQGELVKGYYFSYACGYLGGEPMPGNCSNSKDVMDPSLAVTSITMKELNTAADQCTCDGVKVGASDNCDHAIICAGLSAIPMETIKSKIIDYKPFNELYICNTLDPATLNKIINSNLLTVNCTKII